MTRGPPWPSLTPVGPFPGPLCPPSLWAPSSCTKVAVVPVLPMPGWGLCFQSFLRLCPYPGQSCSLVFLDSSASCAWVCAWVCVGVFRGGWVWLEWVWQGFGKGWGKDGGCYLLPLPRLQAVEAWEGGCLLPLPCVLQMCQNGWVGGIGGAWQSSPRVALSKQYSSPAGEQHDRGEGWVGTWGSPCTAVYIQGCSLSGTHCGHLCV